MSKDLVQKNKSSQSKKAAKPQKKESNLDHSAKPKPTNRKFGENAVSPEEVLALNNPANKVNQNTATPTAPAGTDTPVSPPNNSPNTGSAANPGNNGNIDTQKGSIWSKVLGGGGDGTKKEEKKKGNTPPVGGPVSVVKTPAAPSPIPVPFPQMGRATQGSDSAPKRIKPDKKMPSIKEKGIDPSNGDEPGILQGLPGHENKGGMPHLHGPLDKLITPFNQKDTVPRPTKPTEEKKEEKTNDGKQSKPENKEETKPINPLEPVARIPAKENAKQDVQAAIPEQAQQGPIKEVAQKAEDEIVAINRGPSEEKAKPKSIKPQAVVMSIEPIREVEASKEATKKTEEKPKANAKDKAEAENIGDGSLSKGNMEAVSKDAKGAIGGGPGGLIAASKSEEEAPKEAKLDASSSDALVKSVINTPATQLGNAMNQATTLNTQVQQGEKDDLAANLPTLEQPTGVATLGEKHTEKKSPKTAKGATPGLKAGNEGILNTDKAVEETHTDHGPAPKDNKTVRFQEPQSEKSWWDKLMDGSWFSSLTGQARNYTNSIQTSDGGVSTSAGARPKADLTGDANPHNNEKNQQEANATVGAEQAKSDAESKKDFGENMVYPDVERETLKSNVELSPVQAGPSSSHAEMEGIDAETAAKIDAAAESQKGEELATQSAAVDEAKGQYDTSVANEKASTYDQIAAEDQRVKEQQEAEQAANKAKVEEHRASWKEENQKVKDSYKDKSDAKRKEIDNKIDTEVKTKEAEVETKYSDAEKEAAEKKKTAESDAAKKKQEGKDKEKEKSWWERAADAISNFFDAIRKAVNAIFDALRAAVKAIIEKAKKLVNAIIDKLRDFVVAAIKAFGEALKAFADIALAAFPGIRDKFKAMIDEGVNLAVKAVNALAEGLKKFANALLDVLGAAIDAYLALYQAAINAVLDVLEAIALLAVKLAKVVATLIMAVYDIPDHFMGQLTEEFLGTNLDEPLPFERKNPIPGKEWSPDEAPPTGAGGGDQTELMKLLAKGPLQDGDVVMDPVQNMELDGPLWENMDFSMFDGEGKTYPGSSDPVTLNEIAPGHGASEGAHTTAGDKTGAKGGAETWTIRDEFDLFMKNLNKPNVEGAKAKPEQATSDKIPAESKIGPLTRGMRLEFVWDRLKAAMRDFWEKNKVAIIIGIVVAIQLIIGLIAANIFTGGAISALIPPILDVMMMLFMAEAMIKISAYLFDFFKFGIGGNRTNASKAAARALVILLGELVFFALFEIKPILNALKGGAKGVIKLGVNSVKATMKAGMKGLKTLGKMTLKGFSKAAMKGGKMAVKATGKVWSKGAKRLDDFLEKLKNFRFKKFKLKRKGKWFQLWGQFNPWVLMATGEIKDLKTKGNVGDVVRNADGAIEGVIIGARGSKALKGEMSQLVKKLKGNEALRKSVNDLIYRGGKNIDPVVLAKGLKNMPVDKLDDVVKGLGKVKNIDGVDSVIKDLASGGNKATGASFVLEYIGRNPSFARSITKLESKVRKVGRVYDVVSGSFKYEFKSWKSFIEPSFIKQIARDVSTKGNKFKWIFDGKIGKSTTELQKIAKEILQNNSKLAKYLTKREMRTVTQNIDRILKAIEVAK